MHNAPHTYLRKPISDIAPLARHPYVQSTTHVSKTRYQSTSSHARRSAQYGDHKHDVFVSYSLASANETSIKLKIGFQPFGDITEILINASEL